MIEIGCYLRVLRGKKVWEVECYKGKKGWKENMFIN